MAPMSEYSPLQVYLDTMTKNQVLLMVNFDRSARKTTRLFGHGINLTCNPLW